MGNLRGVLFLRIMDGKLASKVPIKFVLEEPKRYKYSSICFYFFSLYKEKCRWIGSKSSQKT